MNFKKLTKIYQIGLKLTQKYSIIVNYFNLHGQKKNHFKIRKKKINV